MADFERLLSETEADRQALLSVEFIRRGVAGDLSLASYCAFLQQAYHHVRHTVPLLMACGSRLPRSLEWLRNAMAEYIEEELGHQEWILNDLAACGVDAEAVRYSRPGIEADALVAYAYYVIEHRHPVAFLGMVHVLEGTSVVAASEAAKALSQRLGLGPKCFSYLNSHGALDTEHVAFFESLIERLDAPALEEVIFAAKVFYKLYGDVFRALPLDDVAEAA